MEVLDDLRNESEGNFILLSLSSSPSQSPENSRFVLISMSCMMLCLFVTECNRCRFAQAKQNERFAISGIEAQGHFASLSHSLPSSIKKDKLFQFSFHFSSFVTVYLLFKCRFVA